jgi:hypothetical protein
MKKIFRVKATQTFEHNSLVLASNDNEARLLFLKAIKLGNVEPNFSYHNFKKEKMECNSVALDASIKHEIKAYGIIIRQGECVFGDKAKDLLKDISEKIKDIAKEEWLKKNHLEFKFD